mgnify:FL=1
MSKKQVNCENCHTCEECKKNQVDAFSPEEILGYTAIVIGVVGGLAQMKQTGGSRDLSSFSWIYLTCALTAEALFLIQGIMLKNISISLTRAVTMLYFGFFLLMWFLYEFKKKKKK